MTSKGSHLKQATTSSFKGFRSGLNKEYRERQAKKKHKALKAFQAQYPLETPLRGNARLIEIEEE